MQKPPIIATPDGVELLAPDIRGHFGTRCQAHHHIEAWESAAVALVALGFPEDWCPVCGMRWALTPLGQCLLCGQEMDPEPDVEPVCTDCLLETGGKESRAC